MVMFCLYQKGELLVWTKMWSIFRSTTSTPFIVSRSKPRGGCEIYSSSGKRINESTFICIGLNLRNCLWNLYQVFLNGIGVCISDGSVDLNLSENQSNWKMFVLTHLLTKETITNTVGSYSYLLTHYISSPKMSHETRWMEMNENQQWSWNTLKEKKPQLQKRARFFKAQQAVDSDCSKSKACVLW